MTNKDEALKWMIDNKKLESQYPTMTYEQGFAHGYEAHRVEQALEQPKDKALKMAIELIEGTKRHDYVPEPQQFETTYVEVCMPVALEEMAHAVLKAMRTQWLIDNGFPEEGGLI
jgi:hypothetical protein